MTLSEVPSYGLPGSMQRAGEPGEALESTAGTVLLSGLSLRQIGHETLAS